MLHPAPETGRVVAERDVGHRVGTRFGVDRSTDRVRAGNGVPFEGDVGKSQRRSDSVQPANQIVRLVADSMAAANRETGDIHLALTIDGDHVLRGFPPALRAPG